MVARASLSPISPLFFIIKQSDSEGLFDNAGKNKFKKPNYQIKSNINRSFKYKMI
jgi:hypothetical protein